MAIWFQSYTLEQIEKLSKGNMLEHLGIVFTALEKDALCATMPVDHRTRQPAGILHGGASVVLAESLASTAGNMVLNNALEYCVGLEINANHVRTVRDGIVHGRTSPLHLGRATQVWETKIQQGDKLVCVSRMTLAVLQKKS